MPRFNPADPYPYLNDWMMFSLVHNNVFSVTNMSPREIRESIVEDTLMITMLERRHQTKIHFGMTRLLKWIPREFHYLVMDQLNHDEIFGLLDFSSDKREIRIVDNVGILQAAMDYIGGPWYVGFKYPDGSIVDDEAPDMSEEEILKIVEKLSPEIKAIEMDIAATAPIPETVQ